MGAMTNPVPILAPEILDAVSRRIGSDEWIAELEIATKKADALLAKIRESERLTWEVLNEHCTI